MATTYTTNYSLAKPAEGDLDWDAEVNGNFDTIDGQMKSNADAAATANVTEIVLAPEFAGGGWHADGSGSAITDENGTVKFDGTDQRNCYWMECSEASLKDFTLQVEVKLPPNFTDWDTSAIVIDFCTETTSASDQALDVAVHRNRGGSAVCTDTGNVSGSAATWTTVTISETSIESGPTTWAAGDVLTLKLTCKSKDDNYVKVGAITISYE